MKKGVRISNKVLIIFFVIAIILSVVSAYFSVYANSAKSYSNPEYKVYYAEPPKQAYVGVVIGDNRSVGYGKS